MTDLSTFPIFNKVRTQSLLKSFIGDILLKKFKKDSNKESKLEAKEQIGNQKKQSIIVVFYTLQDKNEKNWQKIKKYLDSHKNLKYQYLDFDSLKDLIHQNHFLSFIKTEDISTFNENDNNKLRFPKTVDLKDADEETINIGINEEYDYDIYFISQKIYEKKIATQINIINPSGK